MLLVLDLKRKFFYKLETEIGITKIANDASVQGTDINFSLERTLYNVLKEIIDMSSNYYIQRI